MQKTSVLITGAAGKIGTVLAAALANRYDLTLTDIREFETAQPFVKADITDPGSMKSICTGVDTVIHLAADPREDASWASLLPNNIIGGYTVFQAAEDAGCRRIIFASSGHTVSGYPAGRKITLDAPARPANLYGATKLWGEAVARFYSDQRGLSCICLRLGWVESRHSPHIHPNQPGLDRILTYEDLTRLIVASIEAPADLRFGIFFGTSNNYWNRFDLRKTRAVLGYKPEDDAFALAGVVGIRKLKWLYRKHLKHRIKSVRYAIRLFLDGKHGDRDSRHQPEDQQRIKTGRR